MEMERRERERLEMLRQQASDQYLEYGRICTKTNPLWQQERMAAGGGSGTDEDGRKREMHQVAVAALTTIAPMDTILALGL